MENFIFQNPTKLVFGKGTIARLGELIPAGKRVMVTFGGGSVRRNGVYDEVCAALAGRDTVEFWGIEPNPSIETLRERSHWARSAKSISCWPWAAVRSSTARNSSRQDCSTTAMHGNWCARALRSAPYRWVRC